MTHNELEITARSALLGTSIEITSVYAKKKIARYLNEYPQTDLTYTLGEILRVAKTGSALSFLIDAMDTLEVIPALYIASSQVLSSRFRVFDNGSLTVGMRDTGLLVLEDDDGQMFIAHPGSHFNFTLASCNYDLSDVINRAMFFRDLVREVDPLHYAVNTGWDSEQKLELMLERLGVFALRHTAREEQVRKLLGSAFNLAEQCLLEIQENIPIANAKTFKDCATKGEAKMLGGGVVVCAVKKEVDHG